MLVAFWTMKKKHALLLKDEVVFGLPDGPRIHFEVLQVRNEP